MNAMTTTVCLLSMRLATTIAVSLTMPAWMTTASARDPDGRYAQSPLKPWFDSLHSHRGPCCSDADGTALSDIDWESVNDPAKPTVHYRVRVDGEWWDVTDDAVLTQPNLYGRTMVWPVRYGDYASGQHRIEIRCFIPGSMM